MRQRGSSLEGASPTGAWPTALTDAPRLQGGSDLPRQGGLEEHGRRRSAWSVVPDGLCLRPSPGDWALCGYRSSKYSINKLIPYINTTTR